MLTTWKYVNDYITSSVHAATTLNLNSNMTKREKRPRWLFDGLMQEQRNSSALAMGYVFLVLAHRFILSANHTGDHIEKILLTNAKDMKFDN